MILQDIQAVQLIDSGGYILNEAHYVPADLENADYQLIQTWIAAGNTPAPASVDPLADAKAEIARIAAAIPQGMQQITLDDNGEAMITHNIGSLWYCVFVQPVDCNMPNMYVLKASDNFSILDGKKNEFVIYHIESLLPPVGSENLIFYYP